MKLCACALVALWFVGCNKSSEKSADPVAVTVNGTAIRESQVLAETDNRINVNKVRDAAKGLVYDESSRQATRDFLRAEIINALIERALIAQQLQADRIDITDAEVDAHLAEMARQRGHTLEQAEHEIKEQGRMLADVKQRIRWNMLGVEKLYNAHATDKKSLTEAEALQMYAEYPAEFDQPETRRVSHILIRANFDEPQAIKYAARAKAQSLLDRIRGGEDFAELARTYSDDHSSKLRGGDRGFSKRGIITSPTDDPFGNVAFGMTSIGQISDVVETRDGYHIIKLTGLNPATRLSFEQAKSQLVDDFKYREIANFWDAFSGDLRAKAKIEYTAEELARRNQAEARQRLFNEEMDQRITAEQARQQSKSTQ